MNFECHITVPTEYAEAATAVAEKEHWKTSEIARDPVLGNKNYFYLTTHDTSLLHMQARMEDTVLALTQNGVPVLREKIEIIVHDKRSNI